MPECAKTPKIKPGEAFTQNVHEGFDYKLFHHEKLTGDRAAT
jgi:hypothetical protein